MSRRSAAWTEKKGQLDRRELRIREELEEAATRLEDRTKTVLKISLGAGLATLAAYTIYNVASPKKEKKKKKTQSKEKEVVHVKSGLSLKKIFLEKATIAAISFIGGKLMENLESRLENKEEDNQ